MELDELLERYRTASTSEREKGDYFELLVRVRDHQGLGVGPWLAVGDGAPGFWKTRAKVYPGTHGQPCWVLKTANVLKKLPKRTQPRVKAGLQGIWMAATHGDAEQAFDAFFTT